MDEADRLAFLERTKTPAGVVAELFDLHRVMHSGGLIPEGSDVAARFSLLTGIVKATIEKLEDAARR